MRHHHEHFTTGYSPTIFVSIIGAEPHRRHIAVAPSRSEALDGLIEYLNFMMDEEVLPSGASEAEIYRAIEDNLYAQTEIVECALMAG